MSFILTILFITAFYSVSFSQGKLSGLVYTDYFYNISRDTAISLISPKALSGVKDFNGFVFRRIYFTYDYDISQDFFSRFRLEADNSEPKYRVFVKDAFLIWKNIFPGHELVVGLHPTPAFDISESVWGYRSLEKTIMDLRGIVSSRDVAVSLKGKFDDNGQYKYWAMIGNNSSVNLETDKYKRYYLNFNFNPVKNFYATLYGDLKAQESIKINDEKLSRDVISTALFLGYREKDKFSFGTEGFYQSDKNKDNSAGQASDVNAIGISVFGSVNLSSQFIVIGRYDYFDPDTDRTGDVRNYFLFALNFIPVDKFMIMPNMQIETFETIYKASVTGRITFYWSFL